MLYELLGGHYIANVALMISNLDSACRLKIYDSSRLSALFSMWGLHEPRYLPPFGMSQIGTPFLVSSCSSIFPLSFHARKLV